MRGCGFALKEDEEGGVGRWVKVAEAARTRKIPSSPSTARRLDRATTTPNSAAELGDGSAAQGGTDGVYIEQTQRHNYGQVSCASLP